MLDRRPWGLHGCVISDGHPHDCVDLGGARTLEVLEDIEVELQPDLVVPLVDGCRDRGDRLHACPDDHFRLGNVLLEGGGPSKLEPRGELLSLSVIR